MTLVPEEIFFRAFRAVEFDICELSLSSYTIQTARGESPYIATPAFVSRAFRHAASCVCTPKGKKVVVPEQQLTANVWARAFLRDDYGVYPSDIYWVRGGIENPTRPEKIAVDLPRGVGLDTPPRARRFPL
jgi:4,5-dihydroxyphthalate decarboxylase